MSCRGGGGGVVLGSFFGGVGSRGRVGGQGGCERRIEVFVKIQKKKKIGGGGGYLVGGSCLGHFLGRGEVGSRWGVRVDVNEELKEFFLGGGGVGYGGSGRM